MSLCLTAHHCIPCHRSYVSILIALENIVYDCSQIVFSCDPSGCALPWIYRDCEVVEHIESLEQFQISFGFGTWFINCLLFTIKSHFIVAWLNGESPHIKIKKVDCNFSHFHCLDALHRLATVARKRVHLNCMVSLFSPFLSKKEMTLNI